jgi:hypothetical protein
MFQGMHVSFQVILLLLGGLSDLEHQDELLKLQAPDHAMSHVIMALNFFDAPNLPDCLMWDLIDVGNFLHNT